MATFEVKVVRIDSAEKHPNADKLTLNRVGGYTAITNIKEDGSWRFKAGDLAVYVPENAVIPEDILKHFGYWNAEKGVGFLGGKKGDRVRPLRLRGIYSEGLLFPITEGHDCMALITPHPEIGEDELIAFIVEPGDDVTEHLGITKYEPPIPVNMAGEVFNASGIPIRYDIEAWEKYPDVIRADEEVIVTEKLHGTFTGIACVPSVPDENAFESAMDIRDIYIYSKGMGAQGLCFKDNQANAMNLYVRSFKTLTEEQLSKFSTVALFHGGLHLIGETFGPGVQDLHYGMKTPEFRVFDAYAGTWPKGRFLNEDELVDLLQYLAIPRVPLLGKFFYTESAVMAFRDGKDTLSNSNVREGVVVRPVKERRDDMLGRIQLKLVSPDYKLRKGGGEEVS